LLCIASKSPNKYKGTAGSSTYKSPNDDNGYDISDYQDIMTEFGTMADFDRLLAEIHQRGMKLIMDLVNLLAKAAGLPDGTPDKPGAAYVFAWNLYYNQPGMHEIL
jgi:hypothetical protein